MRMKEIETLELLKLYALEIDGPINVYWAQTGQTLLFDPFDPRMNIRELKKEKEYSINKDVLAFVQNKKLYVIPYIDPFSKILEENGFEKKSFYVPFSNDDSPVEKADYWAGLKSIIWG